MKNFEHLEETNEDFGDIEKINENETKIVFPLKNGEIKESYIDKNGKPVKFFIKNEKGDILKFVDLKEIEKNINVNYFKNKFAEENIILTDDEVKTIIKIFLDSEFEENLNEFDAEIEH